MLIGGGNDEATDQKGAAQEFVTASKSAARQCITSVGSIMVLSEAPAASDGRLQMVSVSEPVRRWKRGEDVGPASNPRSRPR